jgi:hypothetical protein
MLLNEFLKQHRKVEEQEATIAQLKADVAKEQASNTEQRREIKSLATAVNEQASQIRSVSDQLQMSRSAPQFVAGNP